MNKSLEHICQLIRQIADLHLDTPTNFHFLTAEFIAEVYNGAGPDWMSGISRDILSFILRYYAAAFVIHDVEYNFNVDTGDNAKNRAAFHKANKRMWKNIKKINDSMFAWYNPRRWYWRVKGYAAYKACELYGWTAWTAVGSQKNIEVLKTKAQIVTSITA